MAQRQPMKRVLWTEDENCNLTISWLAISQDPIVGDNQKDNSFWQRIKDTFLKNGSFERTIKGLKSKWSTINRDCQRYNGCLYIIINKNESGTTEEDQKRDAKQLYQERHKTPFVYQSCWEILKKAPKWNVRSTRSNNLTSTTDTGD